ncbi:DHA2 family efflux MFS transporter permease subunit [Rhodococcus sp. PAMC28707]|uniref:MFS transporter n=1 Tax=unclassified Rhodococcus (in: high G+C Gram-positive bacteria) TaxID=192944 RepID=UPI00109E1361|nr:MULTISPECIES: MFS transporter [unclassified Rhodococcus (in: high G+C Gram-positive bacteria)]QCB51560.1 DHA2 family efflux MFS transporter permease subunit [Rhodococcus sp. PAMC28705]QCB60272.1 DHA2 family efflux MFS transporter permease subunit [Rhodococcus sp. PAMC28707]
MTDNSSRVSAPPVEVPRRAWQALVVLLLGMFMALLDTTIVNVALPTISTSLDASEATLSWIISGYALAFGLALIPAGKIGDRIGHKWVFFTGLALFTVASFACGLAQNDLQLVIARIVQGLAGGIFVPAVTAFIQLLFPGQVRGKAFAIMGAVIGVSTALGPIAGGLIIEAFGDENGWRGVFWVNLPIGIIGLVAAALLLPGRPENRTVAAKTGIDWIGLVLITAGLVALLVPLIEGQDQGWPVWTYVSIVAGVVLIAVFAVWEVFYTKRRDNPLVPPKLFAHPAFTGGTILALVYFASFTSIFFTISLLWQSGLGNSALSSGIVMLPFAIGSIIASSQSNRLTQRLGRTVLLIGTSFVAISLIWMWLILATTDAADLTNWKLLLPMLIGGLGNGAFIAPNAQFIVATVDRADAGAASGVIATMQRIGSAVGIAVIGSVLFGNLTITGPDTVASGFMHGASIAMSVSAAFGVVALLLVFALPKRVDAPRPMVPSE